MLYPILSTRHWWQLARAKLAHAGMAYIIPCADRAESSAVVLSYFVEVMETMSCSAEGTEMSCGHVLSACSRHPHPAAEAVLAFLRFLFSLVSANCCSGLGSKSKGFLRLTN